MNQYPCSRVSLQCWPETFGKRRMISQVSRRPIKIRFFFSGRSSPPPVGTRNPKFAMIGGVWGVGGDWAWGVFAGLKSPDIYTVVRQ